MLQLDPSLFTHHPPLVLIAEDEKNTSKMLETIFQRAGFQVECAYNGIKALDMAQMLLPDLMLLDIMMPGMNGFDVLRAMRENPSTRTIPTIVVTAQAREVQDLERGLNLGADDYLYKPFQPTELIARAQAKMRNRKLAEDLERRSHELEVLLEVSAQLNEKLYLDEVLDLIPARALDLLPGDAGVLFVFGAGYQVHAIRVHTRQPLSNVRALQDADLGGKIYDWLDGQRARRWTPDNSLIPTFGHGLATPLTLRDTPLGVLLLVSQESYDDRQLRLFSGIGSQSALALRNAQLYDIETRHASELEERVRERTRELESTQQLLLRQEKLASIGHLAASIAHEINNPLMPIGNLLEDHLEEIDQQNVEYDKKAMGLIKESLERIRRIVSRLLDFTGKRSEGLSLIQVESVLEAVVDLNRKFFANNKVTIEASLPPLPQIYGSKDQLEQVFMNLALNAQAAMEKGGTLKIQAWQEGSEILITFEDNGSGIAPENIDRIFDPFFSTKPNGTGLGLFVSYGIIQGHSGSIVVESTLGVGTRFTIRLPTHATEGTI